MWYLEYISKEQEEDYLKLLIDKVKEGRDAINIRKIKRYLTDSKIKELLLSYYYYQNRINYIQR